MNKDNLIPDYLYSRMSAISARTDWLTYWQGLVQKTILCQNCERISIYTNISKQFSPSHDQSPVPTQVRFNQIALWASLCFLQIHQLPWVLTKLSNRTRFQLILQVDSQNVTKRNTSKMTILVCTNLSYLTLEGPGRQTVDTRSTFGLALKTLGYNTST